MLNQIQNQIIGTVVNKTANELVKNIKKSSKPRKPSIIEGIYHDPDRYVYSFSVYVEDGELIFSGRAKRRQEDVEIDS